jgi:hypothetical protein
MLRNNVVLVNVTQLAVSTFLAIRFSTLWIGTLVPAC